MTETTGGAHGGVPFRVKYVDGEPVPGFPEECEPHTESSRGDLGWDEWAKRMGQTHVQRQCKGCGLWAIWEPKTEVTP